MLTVNYVQYLKVERPLSRERIIMHLPRDWNIYAIKAHDEKIDFGRDILQECVFDSPLFSQEFSDEEIQKEQDWLTHSFYLILQYNYNWHKPYNKNKNELKKNYEKIAKMVKYFREFFTKNKIDFLIIDVDCRISSIVPMLVAKRLGIRPIVLGEGRIPETVMLRKPDFNPVFWKPVTQREIYEFSNFFRERYSKREKQEYKHIYEKNKNTYSINLDVVFTDSKKLYNKIFHSKKTQQINKIERIPLEKTINDRLSRQIRKTIVPLMLDKPDFNKRFLFFPIHHDEEALLSWGEHFINQYDLMEKVSECLPLNTYLYIKPHPNWLCVDAPISEMKRLKNHDNIKIIPPLTDPLELIKHSISVVTVNSTTGMEAIGMGKPVITFGHSFYAIKDVTLCVHDLKDLPAAIETVLYNPEKSFDQKKRDLLLAEYYKHLIPFKGITLDFDPKKGDVNGKRIAEEIIAYIEYVKGY